MKPKIVRFVIDGNILHEDNPSIVVEDNSIFFEDYLTYEDCPEESEE
jgi:hypothetical protein